MTEQEILKGNELIAKFMGAKLYTPKYAGIKSLFNKYDCPVYEFGDGIRPYAAEQLLFHCDWSWLMPAAEKAAMYVQVNDKGFSLQVKIHNSLNIFDLQQVFISTVNFIKWKNEN